MATFYYKATTSDNKLIQGRLEVENEDVARALLMEQGVSIVSIEENRLYDFGHLTLWSRHVSKKDIVVFSRQLAVMIGAAIPIVQALKVISDQTENERLKKIIKSVYMEVSAGSTLSDAMKNYTNLFDGFYVNMIRSGETTGRLDEVLTFLADQLEKDYDLQRKVRGALMYPITVVLAMCIASIVVLVYVIPRLVMVFETMGVPIPWTTEFLIILSSIISDFWWVIILGGLLLFLIGRAYLVTHLGRLSLSAIRFRLPVFGKLYKNIFLLQITRSLHTLLVGGVTLADSLVIVEKVVQDIQYRNIIKKVTAGVRDGKSLANEFSQEHLIPTLMSNMMSIGEKTGKLDYILEKLSDYYAKEIDVMTNTIMTLLEPLVMVLLGIGVALIVSAVFLPLYTIPSF